MKVLVIGGGGREHALCLALSNDPGVTALHCAPGNAGIAELATLHAVNASDPDAVADLADALGQIARLPARFVLGALAGLRLVGLLVSDWRELALARRARGVADRGRLRRFLGMAFALFVLAIRRGTHLATAMEARGFGTDPAVIGAPRTWARPSRLRVRDGVIVLLAVAIAACGVGSALWAGTWTFVLTL